MKSHWHVKILILIGCGSMDKIKRERKNFFFAYNMIFDIQISEHAKIVYMCLCRFVDGSDQAFPSHKTICSKTGIKSKTTVKAALNELMKSGLLDVQAQYSQDGGQTSNIYTIYNEPNKTVIKKYSTDDEKNHANSKSYIPRSADDSPQPADDPGQQMTTPRSADDWRPGQQMTAPGSADGYIKIPNQKIQSLKISSSYSPKPENAESSKCKNDDEDNTKGEVSELLAKIGIEHIKHKDMIEPIRALIANLMQTGKVGQARYSREEIADIICSLTAADIDTVIDRYTQKAASGEIRNADNFIKACLVSAGKSAKILELSKKSGAEGIDRGHPSFDIDEYIRLSMKKLHNE
jgi:hypothetical protein